MIHPKVFLPFGIQERFTLRFVRFVEFLKFISIEPDAAAALCTDIDLNIVNGFFL
jgi:hypothetical protein